MVAAVCRLVVLSQGEKSVATDTCGWLWLRRKIAEQLTATVDQTVTIAIEAKKSVIGAGGRPGKPLSDSVVIQVEIDAATRIRQIKSIAEYVNNDWRRFDSARTLAKIVVPIRTNP